MSIFNTIALLKDRVSDLAIQSPHMLRRDRFWEASMDLWQAEMNTYETLWRLGFHAAAECAWKRRSAASELCHVLTVCS